MNNKLNMRLRGFCFCNNIIAKAALPAFSLIFDTKPEFFSSDFYSFQKLFSRCLFPAYRAMHADKALLVLFPDILVDFLDFC